MINDKKITGILRIMDSNEDQRFKTLWYKSQNTNEVLSENDEILECLEKMVSYGVIKKIPGKDFNELAEMVVQITDFGKDVRARQFENELKRTEKIDFKSLDTWYKISAGIGGILSIGLTIVATWQASEIGELKTQQSRDNKQLEKFSTKTDSLQRLLEIHSKSNQKNDSLK